MNFLFFPCRVCILPVVFFFGFFFIFGFPFFSMVNQSSAMRGKCKKKNCKKGNFAPTPSTPTPSETFRKSLAISGVCGVVVAALGTGAEELLRCQCALFQEVPELTACKHSEGHHAHCSV